jgi:hypothetical protein
MNTGSWEPGVVYLLALIFAELILMGVMRTMTRHGG